MREDRKLRTNVSEGLQLREFFPLTASDLSLRLLGFSDNIRES